MKCPTCDYQHLRPDETHCIRCRRCRYCGHQYQRRADAPPAELHDPPDPPDCQGCGVEIVCHVRTSDTPEELSRLEFAPDEDRP